MFDGLTSDPQVFFVDPSTWPTVAERCRPHLQKMAASSGGRYLAEDIEADIERGHHQVWIVLHGGDLLCVMLTQLMTYPRSRALRVVGLVGHQHKRWAHMMEHVAQVAKVNMGCDRMECLHDPRHGILLSYSSGWAPFHILSEKML